MTMGQDHTQPQLEDTKILFSGSLDCMDPGSHIRFCILWDNGRQ